MTERAAPFYCPYCGDEDLRMFGQTHGEWRCGACRRVFGLRYVGIAPDWTAQAEPAAAPIAEQAAAEQEERQT